MARTTHIARAHRAEDVQHEHQSKGERAAAETRERAVPSVDDGVDRKTRDESGEHKSVGDAAIARVVVSDDDGERDEKCAADDG